MKTLVIIPTYNELENISTAISNVLGALPDVDILVVDDNSPDGTAAVVRALANDKRINILERNRKLGLGPAYLAGFDWGIQRGYEYLVQMDADGSHRPQDLKLLLASKADLVIGSRWITGGRVLNWPRHREFISKVGNWYARVMLGTQISDMTAGFRVYSSSFLKSLDLSNVASQGYSFQVELAYLASKKAEILEVPITFVERELGKSKMTLMIVFEALVNVTKWGLKRLLR